MEFRQALRQLGVRDDTLTITEKERLDRDGYLPLEGMYTREQAARMLAEHEKLWEIERTGQEGAADTVVNTQNKCGSDAYDVCFIHPRVLAVVAHVLQEEFLSLGSTHPDLAGRPRMRTRPCTRIAAARSRPENSTVATPCGR